MSFKNYEKETAKRFLVELGTPVHELLTLKEFARRDPDPEFNIDHLDSVCPDIVAITTSRVIGVELTAYSGDNSQNRLSAVLDDLPEAGAELAGRLRELQGFQIYVSPNESNSLRQRDVRPLAAQVLEFVRFEHTSLPLGADQDRHYLARVSGKIRNPFVNWPMLEKHIRSITVHSRSGLHDEPVMLYGGFGSHFGTRLEHLTQTIVTKAGKLRNGYTRGLGAVWLLIHADGNPSSSRIAPMWPDEIERLLRSSARQSADESGFDRVFLWDGVRGGIVDFTRPESKFVEHA
jgi:hypothetical protein